MFINAQYLKVMRTLKINIAGLAFLAAIFLSSCATTGYTPQDDVYYSPDDQVVPARTTVVAKQTKPTAGTVYEGDVQEAQANGSYENTTAEPSNDTVYLDDDAYYNIDYASRLRKFSDDNNDDNYFDDGGCTSYASSPNVSLSFGFGTGFGWGYPYYGWGYPSYGWGYPYYGWGYPSYGWGGSYWSGYNNGYWNGYWDGYYGGGYYPGYPGYTPGYPYYPDYGYRNTVQYGPRGGGRGYGGGRTGGSDVPGAGRGMSSSNYSASRGRSSVSSGRTKAAVAAGSSPSASTRRRPKESVRVNNQNKPQNRVSAQKKQTINNKQARPKKATVRYTKPVDSRQHASARPVKRTNVKPAANRTTRPSSTTYVRRQSHAPKRYSKPKAYRSLPSQQPRSSKEYVRPSSRTSNNRTYKPRPSGSNARKATINNGSRVSPGATTHRRTTTRSSATRTKSYSSPSRSRSSSRSYSSPTRSSSSRSSSSSHSYSGSSSSGSSGSSSRSSGGGGYRGGGRR